MIASNALQELQKQLYIAGETIAMQARQLEELRRELQRIKTGCWCEADNPTSAAGHYAACLVGKRDAARRVAFAALIQCYMPPPGSGADSRHVDDALVQACAVLAAWR